MYAQFSADTSRHGRIALNDSILYHAGQGSYVDTESKDGVKLIYRCVLRGYRVATEAMHIGTVGYTTAKPF